MATEIDVNDVKLQLKAISDSVKEEGVKAISLAEKGLNLSEKHAGQIDEILSKQGEFQSILTGLAQKTVAQDAAGGVKSIGEQVTESAEFIEGAKRLKTGRGAMNIGIKAVTTISSLTTGTGGAGSLVRPDRIQSPMVTPGLRRMTVRDLMAGGRTTSNMIEYVQESGFQNMAAIVAEGATKPQSDLAFTLMQQAVATIAHWIRATKLILDDAPMLQSYIDNRLRYGLALVEEAQLLMGSGTGGNLNGVYTQATAYAAPFTITDATVIDTLRLALLQVEVAEYPASAIVLNPIDWARVELTKDTQGNYIVGNPQSTIAPRLWNRDVVATNAMTVDKFLVGAFSLASQVFDREDANVVISTEDQDNFIKNLITIRAEERIGMAVYRPEAFVKGDLGFVA